MRHIEGEMPEDLIANDLPDERRAARDQIDAGRLDQDRALLLQRRWLVIGDLRLARCHEIELVDPGRPFIFVAGEEILEDHLAARLVDPHTHHAMQPAAEELDRLRLDRIEVVGLDLVVGEFRIVDRIHALSSYGASMPLSSGRTWHHARCPVANSLAGGSLTKHAAAAWRQRVLKRQPAGMA